MTDNQPIEIVGLGLEPAPHRVALRLDETGRKGALFVNGKPLRGISGVTVESRAGSITTLTLRMPMVAAAVDGYADVQLDDATQAGLIALGWTPPQGLDTPPPPNGETAAYL